MEPSDIHFLQIRGYSLGFQQWVTNCRERVVRYHADGRPDWTDMQRVADCVLFELDVDEFYSLPEMNTDVEGYWVPYKFQLDRYGTCVVRVWDGRTHVNNSLCEQ
jgi:hypothetical protein